MLKKNAELFWKATKGTNFDSVQEVKAPDDTVQNAIIFKFVKDSEISYVIGSVNPNGGFAWRMADSIERTFIANDIIEPDAAGESFS